MYLRYLGIIQDDYKVSVHVLQEVNEARDIIIEILIELKKHFSVLAYDITNS